MKVLKRDGTLEEFDLSKIVNAVKKAYKSQGLNVSKEILDELDFSFNRDHKEDVLTVETIQDEVEKILIDISPYKVAKAYILYRELHKESRLINDKINYILKYSASSENAASNSNTDANANNSVKNVASIECEVFKDKNRLIQRQMMKNKLNELYPKVAKQYEVDLGHHIIYTHDESSSPIPKAYCGAYSLYPLMTEGVGNIDKVTPYPPNDIQSFSGQVTNLVFALSAQTKGAVALGDYFVTLSYYVTKEFGPNWHDKLDVEINNSHVMNYQANTIKRAIRKGMKQFIYGVNQPQGNRGFQSPFCNLQICDKYYFESLFNHFVFPDFTEPKWEHIDALQRIFVELLRDIRLVKPCTFPVLTFSLLYDEDGYASKEYAELCAEEWAKGSSHFLYHSNNVDSLSSCCFHKDTKILWKTSYDGVHCTTIKELYDNRWNPYKKNLRVFHNGSWVNGKSIKLNNRKMYRVITENNKEFIMTDNHINVTYNGEKFTEELTTSDYLMFNTIPLQAVKENDEHLTYEQGFVIGAFLGDGSFGGTYSDGTIYDTQFSQNKEKYSKCVDMINIACHQLDINSTAVLGTIHNNVYPVRVSSKVLVSFIQKWTNWKRGTYSYNKELNLNCLLQSYEFRRGILAGWYNTDGGNSNRCYTSSTKLKDCMEILITSLGLQSIINISDRTDEPVIIREELYNRNYPLWCIRWYEPANHRLNKDSEHSWKKKNNSIYFKIKSIEPVDYNDDVYCIECNNQDEPYFTLPNGLITHNCRVQNKLQNNYFTSTTGMLGLMTGSCNVITLNINRIVQDWYRSADRYLALPLNGGFKNDLKQYLINILERVYKYHIAYKTMLYELEEQGMITYSTANYLYISKLYSTVGAIGYYEAAKFLGLEDNSEEYQEFIDFILETISEENTKHSIYDKKRPFIFNLECIPGENLAVKLYNWDKESNYFVPSDQNLYNCYFFNPWKESDPLVKLKLHGEKVCKASSGGQGCHINLDTHLSKEQYLKLMDYAREVGCNYFTFNIPMSECLDCKHVVNAPISKCPKCESKNINYYTRIIGFLVNTANWSKERQIEFKERLFGKKKQKDF